MTKLQVAFFIAVLSIGCLHSTNGQEAPTSEFDGVTVHSKSGSPGNKWALLIGVNYTGRQIDFKDDRNSRSVLPSLDNAANDAKKFAALLTDLYGYKREHVVTLTDDDDHNSTRPDYARIVNELHRLTSAVQRDDSVLFFFAGHGHKLVDSTTGNAVALLPYDVMLKDGSVLGNTIGLPSDLFTRLKAIPAKHKLLILDCCYSGEIFNAVPTAGIAFQPASRSPDRRDASLQSLDAFQAMASCRAGQRAADAPRPTSTGAGNNSKFTSVLLEGLKRLPAYSDDASRRVYASHLMAYIRSNSQFDETQRPEIRSLVGNDGEFSFYPSPDARFEGLTDGDQSHLRAMVVGRQGNWWFHEMPWFLPNIRSEILDEYETRREQSRAGGVVDLIKIDELRDAAGSLLKSVPNSRPNVGLHETIKEMRQRHAKMLLKARDPDKFKECLLAIENELMVKSEASAERTTGNRVVDPVTLTNRSASTDASTAQKRRRGRKRLASDSEPSSSGRSSTDEAATDRIAGIDAHSLAIIQHALGNKEKAEQTYEHALKMYATEKTSGESQTPLEHDPAVGDTVESADGVASKTKVLNASLHIMAALCRADYGELLRDPQYKEYKRAAEEFKQACAEVTALAHENGQIKIDSAAFFRILMLCREAEARRIINHWQQADELLEQAKEIAINLAPNHYLLAFVLKERAWTAMVQWRISDAMSSFKWSNEILDKQFLNEARSRGELPPSGNAALPSRSPDTLPAPEKSQVAIGATPRESVSPSQPFDLNGIGVSGKLNSLPTAQIGPEFQRSNDHASKIAYLHSLHGMAMAKRFLGEPLLATQDYRRLVDHVEDALTRFRNASLDPDLEKQFVLRVINTQERLGDCNLFGDPHDRDVKEAVDDYRRALSRVHLLPDEGQQKENRALLLYKQALALGLPSTIQDTELAVEMCRRADEIYNEAEQKKKANGRYQAHGELSTAIVQCLHASTLTSLGKGPPSESASARLRSALLKFRDLVKAAPHGDQVELCLFASKILIEESGIQDRYQILEDADLLLSFCRIALAPYPLEDRNGQRPVAAEQRAYLRPYYDAAMRAKLKVPHKHVKDLLEIQAEATRGSYYLKPTGATPILAIYAFRDECYLLVDVPRGESKCVRLSPQHDLNAIRKAGHSSERLPLPSDVYGALVAWRQSNLIPTSNLGLDLRWRDPIRGLEETTDTPRLVNEAFTPRDFTGQAREKAQKQEWAETRWPFPFRLPPEFEPDHAIPTTSTVSMDKR